MSNEHSIKPIHSRRQAAARLIMVALLALGLLRPALAGQAAAALGVDEKRIAGYTSAPHFGGPNSVDGQVGSDHVKK